MLGQNMTEFLPRGPYTSPEFDNFATEINKLQKQINPQDIPIPLYKKHRII